MCITASSSAVFCANAVAAVLKTLCEIVRLDQPNVFERFVSFVDEDVIDHLERGEVHRAQILGHVRAIDALGDVLVGREASDENVSLALGVKQMAHMPGMNDVEHPMTHNDFLRPRPVADYLPQLFGSLDLVPVSIDQ